MLDPQILRQVKGIQIKTDRLIDEVLAGEYASAFKGAGMEFDELREYCPGDDVRNIDWNVTARTGRPHIKKFLEERELTVILLVDLSGSLQFGSTAAFKADLAAEVSALLAFLADRNNDQVGLIIFSDSVERFIPPQKGRRHALRIIREILTYRPMGRGTNIRAALEFLNRVTNHRSVVFLLSDLIGSGYERALRASALRHDLVAMVIVDPRERDLPNVGLIELCDAESGEARLVDTANPGTRRRWAAEAAERASARDRLLASSGIEAVLLATDRPYLEAFKRFFRRRERRIAL